MQSVGADALTACSRQELLRRNDVFETFFQTEALRLAEARHEMFCRFLTGGRLLTSERGSAATDAEHVSVEFVHQVIFGKRILASVRLTDSVVHPAEVH